MPKPSSPGIGSRFRNAAVTWRNARKATPSQKTPWDWWAKFLYSTASMTANRTFDSGPAAEIRLCRSRPRMACRSIQTAPPADPAEHDEHHRDQEAQHGVGVLEGVEREVALGGDAAVARPVGQVGVPELVQA